MEEEWPIATFILITINLAVFLFTADFTVFNTRDLDMFPVFIEFVDMFGLSPQDVFSRPYTLITHMFIHVDLIHFFGNMLMLFILGLAAEDRIGSGKFLFIYLFSGLSAVPFAFFIEALAEVPATLVGSSGAIFGVMFIAGLLSGWERVPMIKIPLFLAIIFYLIFNSILFVLYFPYSITEFAHFGGFVGGILGFLLVLPQRKKLSRLPRTF